jgi:DnaJ-class molecular chaperone
MKGVIMGWYGEADEICPNCKGNRASTKFGYMQCPHCNGYGSSLKDPEGVNICTRCGGSGLVKKEKE